MPGILRCTQTQFVSQLQDIIRTACCVVLELHKYMGPCICHSAEGVHISAKWLGAWALDLNSLALSPMSATYWLCKSNRFTSLYVSFLSDRIGIIKTISSENCYVAELTKAKVLGIVPI